MAAPVKRELIEALLRVRQASINELAALLNRSPKALYYHVRQLCAVGLMQVLSTRKVAKRTEAVYGMVAERFIIEDLEGDQEAKRAQQRSFKALLRRVEREVSQAEEAEVGMSVDLFRFGVSLSEEDHREFRRRLQEALRFAHQRESAQGTARLTLTTVLVTEELLAKPKPDAE